MAAVTKAIKLKNERKLPFFVWDISKEGTFNYNSKSFRVNGSARSSSLFIEFEFHLSSLNMYQA